MNSSRYANLNRLQSRIVAGVVLTVTLLCVWISNSKYRISFEDRPHRASNDIDLYYAETRSVWEGESYYEAAHRELKARGYPTHSLFNWRTPLPMWLLGQFPDPLFGRWVLGLMGIGLVLAGSLIVYREGSFLEAFLAGLLLGGTTIPIFAGVLFVMPVLWAGVMIGLSLCCFKLERPYLAVFFGIAAAFFRELAVGYCLLMLSFAVMKRNRREAVAWVIALVSYAIFFASHAIIVSSLLGFRGIVQTDDWLRFGGPSFLIACAHVSGFLLVLPQWVAALFLCFAVFGLIGWKSEMGLRTGLTTAGYLAVFSIFGKEVNQYWGAMIAPLLCMGFAKSPTAVCDLLRSVRGKSATPLATANQQ